MNAGRKGLFGTLRQMTAPESIISSKVWLLAQKLTRIVLLYHCQCPNTHIHELKTMDLGIAKAFIYFI